MNNSLLGVHNMDVEGAMDPGILIADAPTKSNWAGVAEGAITCTILPS